MEPSALPFYRLEFAKSAEWKRREDELRTVAARVLIAKDNEEKRRHAAEEDRDALMWAVAMELAMPSEIADFTQQLDDYDAATVQALLENEEQLNSVREDLKLLLDKAYVLPDGRCVFKTEDGTRIFDEKGVEVKNFDPDQIEDQRPRWERYEEKLEREQTLTQERQDLLEFQKLTDEMRAETKEAQEEGGMSRERLDELKKKLSEEAPDAVKRNLSTEQLALDAAVQEPEHKDFRPAAKLDMPKL
jgi:hypothetical protein